jgi:plasmid stability protein
MTLIIHLPDEQEAALKEKAQLQGLSAEEFAQQVLVHGLQASASEPFWKALTRRMHSLPDEVFEHLPTDGASEHDHYLYGSPRRNRQ